MHVQHARMATCTYTAVPAAQTFCSKLQHCVYQCTQRAQKTCLCVPFLLSQLPECTHGCLKLWLQSENHWQALCKFVLCICARARCRFACMHTHAGSLCLSMSFAKEQSVLGPSKRSRVHFLMLLIVVFALDDNLCFQLHV